MGVFPFFNAGSGKRAVQALGFCASLALSGCAGLGGDSDAPPVAETIETTPTPPVNARAEILAFLRSYLNDPGDVRDAAISDPFQRAVGGRNRFVVCVRYNARNADHVYAGARDRLAVFVRGRFDQLLENTQGACAAATYRPFPELEKLGR